MMASKQELKNDPDFKADWSGFISQDESKPINKSRNQIFEQARSVAGTQGNSAWRDYIGDALLYLFEHSSAEEMLELLTKKQYIDQRAYTEISKTLGIEPETAKLNYRNLILK